MLEIIITSSLLIIALIILRCLWRNKISRRLQYALWILVALRLLVPVATFGNPLNVMNVLKSVAEKTEEEKLPEYTSAKPGSVVYNKSWMESDEKNMQDTADLTENSAETEGNILLGHDGTASVQYAKGAEYEKATAVSASSRLLEEKAEGGLGLKEQERILEGKTDLRGFFTRGLWRYVWYGGMAVMGLWMIGCNLIFRYKIHRNRRMLGREGSLMVYVAEGIGSPCLLGIFRPAVYLTEDSVQNQRHREHAVLHELTHYRHGDHVWAFVRSLCLVIYWFDPLVWLAVYLSVRDCEMACDESVTHRLGEEHSKEYGCTLIEMAANCSKGPGLLRCATGFSIRKRELKERITRIAAGRKRMGILLAVLVAVCGTGLAACTFGGAKKGADMGRYVETVVELPGAGRQYWGLAQEGEKIRLISKVGVDIVSTDGGVTFDREKVENMPSGVMNLSERDPFYAAGAVNGARVFRISKRASSGSDMDWIPLHYVITDAGEELELETLEGSYGQYFYSQGYFYIYESIRDGARYHRLDPATGEMELLWEGHYNTYFITADDRLLYLVDDTGVQLFDLEKGELRTEQDQVLSNFIAEKYDRSENIPTMLCPYKNGVYILTHQGMYWHSLYGETVEMVIDGGFGSMGAAGRTFTGLTLRETEGKPEFFVLYNSKELVRYTYDATLPAVPEALRVYSVYEDSQVSKAVSAFRTQHPEIPVIYEVGMNAAYGATVDDVLKNLATEIAAGKGPDILVMDDIPFDSYVEKGVLADLSVLREEMTEETYFVNVVDSFARDGKQYAIPMTFAVPVLAGKGELLEGVESLSDLADLLEQERTESDADYIFCTWDAESTLRLLAQSSQGAWMRDGALDVDAVTVFLTQAKRIYDIQFSVKESFDAASHDFLVPSLWIGSYKQYPLARRFDSDGLYCMLNQAKWFIMDVSFYAGFMSGGERDYMMVQGLQRIYGDTYVKMPGQQYGSCLASSLLAINAGTAYGEESRMFLEYALSSEFLSEEDGFNGTPISRVAYLETQRTERASDGYGIYSGLGVGTASAEYQNYDIEYPTTEDYAKLTDLLDSVTGVNICDTVVYETVVEYGKAALTGEQEIADAVDAIEKRVKIYLAE